MWQQDRYFCFWRTPGQQMPPPAPTHPLGGDLTPRAATATRQQRWQKMAAKPSASPALFQPHPGRASWLIACAKRKLAASRDRRFFSVSKEESRNLGMISYF